MSEHEYVEMILEFKDGEIVSCDYFGEGRQVEPITEPVILRPLGDEPWPGGWKRLERKIKRAFATRT